MNAIIPAWLKAAVEPAKHITARKRHAMAFLNQGLPTKKQERFKYADFSCLNNETYTIADKSNNTEKLKAHIKNYRAQFPNVELLVLINGYFSAELSDSSLEKTGLSIRSINSTHDFDYESEHPFANLALALKRDGLYISVEKNYRSPKALHVLCLLDEIDHALINLHHQIVLHEHATLNISFHQQTLNAEQYWINQLIQVEVGKHAALDFCKIQHEPAEGVHLTHITVQQKEQSRTHLKNLSLGGKFVRDDTYVLLQEKQAHCQATGFYYPHNDDQYIDQHIEIVHEAPLTQSDMLYKGILKNRSRAVFNGKVYVAPIAQKTIAYQANHNLLLSEQSEVNAKPELEIYADDVKCKHGATMGQIDADALFYLRSRNISERQALNILMQGFANEVIERLANPYLTSLTKASIANHDD